MLFEQDENTGWRPDASSELFGRSQGKSTLTSIKLPKFSLSQNLSFLEQYIADLTLYNSFHAGINILQ
jgi:hypothetical protein